MTREMSLILGGCAQITYLIGAAIPVLLMDRFGRRVLLIACSAGLSFCFIMVSILLSRDSLVAAKAPCVLLECRDFVRPRLSRLTILTTDLLFN